MSDRNLRIRVLMEGADRLTRPMREATAGSGRLAQALKATRDQLKDLNAAQAAIGDFRQLKSGLSETERKMAEAQARTTQLGRELAQTTNPTKKLRAEFERARRESSTLSTQYEQQSARLQELRGRLSAAGVSTRDLVSGERRLRSEVAETTASLRDQERRLQQVTDRSRRFSEAQAKFSKLQGTATGLAAGGMASIGTGMAVAAPLTVAVEGSMEFESVMTDINQKVNQSREAGRAMGLELRKMALASNQMPENLQKGMDILTGFGASASQAKGMLGGIGKAATAYKAEIEDLSATSWAVTDNLKVPFEQTSRALDIMAAGGKRGAYELKDMSKSFPTLTANMQGFGSTGLQAVGDLTAALQIVRKGAGSSEEAANNLNNLLSKMNAGDTVKNFKKAGVDIPAALKKAVREGRSPIEEFVRLTQKVTGGDQAKLASIFGDMQVQQALRPLMANMKEYQSIRAEAMGADGTVDKDFADRMNDTAEKVKRARIQAKDLSTTIGDQLSPLVGSLSDRLSGWGSSLAAVAARHPTLTRAAAVAAGVLAALFLVVGGGAIVLAGLVAPFAALTAAATALEIGLLPLIGIAAGVVVGIGLLAAAAYLIYSHWSGVTGWLGGIWAEIKADVSGGIAGITALLVNFSPMGLLYGGIAALLNWMGIDVPSRLSQVGGYMIQGLINGITGMLGALKSTIVNAASSVANWFKEKLGIHSPSRVFAGLGGFVMAGLDQGLANNASGPLARITDLSRQMTRALAVGASGIAISTATPLAAQAPASAAGAATAAQAPAQAATYNITINANSGDAKDIADKVREAIEQIERDRRGRGFGDE